MRQCKNHPINFVIQSMISFCFVYKNRSKTDSKKSGGIKSNNKRSTISHSDITSQIPLSTADDSHDSSSTTATSSKL